jgi:antitoxin (DNA-binding transcriptional repressor) of toxin-antitoxin stability system
MDSANIEDARKRLTQLVDHAAAGHDVVISRRGKPLVRMTRFRRPIRFGLLKGKITVPADFDASMPDDVVTGFEGR